MPEAHQQCHLQLLAEEVSAVAVAVVVAAAAAALAAVADVVTNATCWLGKAASRMAMSLVCLT